MGIISIDSSHESGVELEIVGGLAMITASTLSLEEYQRHGGLQAIEKCKDTDLCRKVKSCKRSRKDQMKNVIVCSDENPLLFGSVI